LTTFLANRSSFHVPWVGRLHFFVLFFLSFNSLHLLLLDNEVSSSPRHHRRGLFSLTDNDYKTVSPREVPPLVVTESSDAAVTLPTTKTRLVMMTSIFGTNPLPPYFPMFLRSIQGSGADGIVIGGDAMELKDILPPNVRHIPLTWDGLHDLISNKLFQRNSFTWIPSCNAIKSN
jgi:hypothetical protein